MVVDASNQETACVSEPAPLGTDEHISNGYAHATHSVQIGNCNEGHVTKNQKSADDDDDDDDACSVTSTTSTDKFHHESFVDFQHKVKQLCLGVLCGYSNSDVSIERIRGGSFNRVVAVTRVPLRAQKFSVRWLQQQMRAILGVPESTVPEHLIVRIPRFEVDSEEMKDSIAVLLFACSRLRLPVPRIVHFDVSRDNAIGSPYTIQVRLPGVKLEDLHLNLEQQKCLVRRIMGVQQELTSITSTSAGTINPSASLLLEVQLHQFDIPKTRSNREPLPKNASTPHQTTFEFLADMCGRWRAHHGLGNIIIEEIWDRVEIVLRSLRKYGFLPNTDRFYFCHTDLVGHNILVEARDEISIDITAVLDWDSEWVFFAPKFMAYRAPLWLWTNIYDGGNYEVKALSIPTNPAQVELKKTFELLAGEEWLRYAFASEYVIARRLFELLRNGVHGPEDWQEARDIFQTWQRMYPETQGLLADDSPFEESEFASEPDVDSSSESLSDEDTIENGVEDNEQENGNLKAAS